MAASQGGSAGRIRAKNAAMAADMKRRGVERTTGRCGMCYAIVTRDTWKSRYNHVCWQGKTKREK